MSGHNCKRWHFELDEIGDADGLAKGIKVIRDGKEIANRKGIPVGHVTEIRTPSSRRLCKQAESYLPYAVEVMFEDKSIVVLNRENFEWNHCAATQLNQCFREKLTAADFITEFKRVTIFDVATLCRILKKDAFKEISDVSQSPLLSDLEDASDSQLQEQSQSADVTNKRPRSDGDDSVLSPPSKMPKHHNALDDTILDKRIGIFELPVTCLCEASSSRLIRSLDKQFLKHLKEKLADDPSSPGVPPIAVLCKDIKDTAEFSKRLKGVYKYEVLGGQHTSKARVELHEEQPDNPLFVTILAEVYVGLSDDEALRLASRHNVNGHFIHKMTHRDYVEACRSKLFLMAKEEGRQVNDSTPPQNSAWKKTCMQCILPTDISRSQKDNIFAQACFTKEVWILATKVMDKYEEGDLKDQRLQKKHLVSKPEFMQQHFQPIQALPPSFQVEMLNAVLNKEKSLKEMKEAASKFRSLQTVRRAFCRTVNAGWDEAAERFPHYTTDERLLQFASFSFAKDTPQPFLAYCQAALRSEIPAECHASLYQLKGCKAYTLQHDILTLSYTDIQADKIPFSGAHLFLANIPEDMAADDVRKLVYTSRQLNTLPDNPLTVFNCIILCSISQMDVVVEEMNRCYDNVIRAYWSHSSTSSSGASLGMVSTVSGIIVGHFSIDGKLKANHFNFKRPIPNFFQAEEKDLYKDLIEAFSFTGQMVLDTMTKGLGASAALMNGRNVISIDNDVTVANSALQSAVSLGISRREGSNAEENDNSQHQEEENENDA